MFVEIVDPCHLSHYVFLTLAAFSTIGRCKGECRTQGKCVRVGLWSTVKDPTSAFLSISASSTARQPNHGCGDAQHDCNPYFHGLSPYAESLDFVFIPKVRVQCGPLHIKTLLAALSLGAPEIRASSRANVSAPFQELGSTPMLESQHNHGCLYPLLCQDQYRIENWAAA